MLRQFQLFSFSKFTIKFTKILKSLNKSFLYCLLDMSNIHCLEYMLILQSFLQNSLPKIINLIIN